ncbi:hypothetical protein [Halohasta salina]|uniref:hypothetical protein n=1 Tax=Halohasta salina TaxID=2961621 RepID=UPI0020A3E762|nr:hypothetical protein [Halohasta salina]
MDLVVAAPGVSTGRLSETLGSDGHSLLFVDRLTRCGVPTADPTTADRLRVAVTPCVSALHAADRFRRRLPAGVGVDAVLVVGAGRQSVAAWADGRFGCPVSSVGSAARTAARY